MIWSEPILGVEWRDLVSGEVKHGRIVNTHFCPVSTEWYMLVAEDTGRFHNVKASDLTARVAWHFDVVGVVEDDGDDAGEGEE
jgi:hypothetical protein